MSDSGPILCPNPECREPKGFIDRSTCRVCGAVYPGATVQLSRTIPDLGVAGEEVPLTRVLEWAATLGFKLGYEGPDPLRIHSEDALELRGMLDTGRYDHYSGDPANVDWGRFDPGDTLYGRTSADGERVDPIEDQDKKDKN